MRRLILTAVCAVSLSACATVDAPAPGLITPVEAILSAATAAPRSVPGRYTMRVAATGRQDGNIYLNSEADYRDQRNLTIAIHPAAMAPLAERYGAQADVFLIGKRIVVTGQARRVHIDFTDNGRPTGKYYYQTHVDVSHADQLSIVATGD